MVVSRTTSINLLVFVLGGVLAIGTAGCPSSAGTACSDNQIICGGICVDPNTDRTYCGASGDCEGANSGTACDDGFVCNGAGSCELSCQDGLIECDDTCTDPNTNGIYCGASGDCLDANAGTICGDGFVCNGAGYCALSCQFGLVNCNDTCIDPDTSMTYCGASGDCLDANAGNACDEGDACVDGNCMPLLRRTCAEINHANGYNVIIESGKVVLGPNDTHAVRCTQVNPTRIRIYETSNYDCLRFDNVGIFEGRGEYDQSLRGDTRNISRICRHLGYANYTGDTTGVNSSPEVVVDADMNGFEVVAAGVDWLWFECFN